MEHSHIQVTYYPGGRVDLPFRYQTDDAIQAVEAVSALRRIGSDLDRIEPVSLLDGILSVMAGKANYVEWHRILRVDQIYSSEEDAV